MIKKLQGDFDFESNSFSKEELKEIKKLLKKGVLKRFSAVLYHRKVGFVSNCMIVWNASDRKITAIGKKLAKINLISHCYERPRFPGFPYNLYTMVHGKSKNDIIKLVKMISKKYKLSDYRLLWSLKEFKKSSPVYVV